MENYDLENLKRLSGVNYTDSIDVPVSTSGYDDSCVSSIDNFKNLIDQNETNADAIILMSPEDGQIYILDDPEFGTEIEEEAPVQDGDNDMTGYKYDADTYNMFGDEDQEMKYVPARYADNPLKDPVTENKSLFDYLREIDER